MMLQKKLELHLGPLSHKVEKDVFKKAQPGVLVFFRIEPEFLKKAECGGFWGSMGFKLSE